MSLASASQTRALRVDRGSPRLVWPLKAALGLARLIAAAPALLALPAPTQAAVRNFQATLHVALSWLTLDASSF